MSNNVVKVDTKAMCLLCYNPESDDALSSPSDSTDSRSVSGFQKLLRYLEVNNSQLYRSSHQFFLNIGYFDVGFNTNEELGVEVSLCFTCRLVMEKFDEVSSQSETNSRQLDKCVQSVCEAIKHADDSPTRVQKYLEQTKTEQLTFSDLFHASFGGNLRIEIFKQCSSKLEFAHRDTVVGPSIISNANATLISNSPSCSNARVNVSSTSTFGNFESDELLPSNPFINRCQENRENTIDSSEPSSHVVSSIEVVASTSKSDQSTEGLVMPVVENFLVGDNVSVDNESSPLQLEQMETLPSSNEMPGDASIVDLSSTSSHFDTSTTNPGRENRNENTVQMTPSTSNSSQLNSPVLSFETADVVASTSAGTSHDLNTVQSRRQNEGQPVKDTRKGKSIKRSKKNETVQSSEDPKENNFKPATKKIRTRFDFCDIAFKFFANRALIHAAEDVLLFMFLTTTDEVFDFDAVFLDIFKFLHKSYTKDYKYLSIEHMRLFMDTLKGPREGYSCLFCFNEVKLNHKSSFQKHFSKHHSIGQTLYHCPIKSCDFSSKHPSTIYEHKLKCTSKHVLDTVEGVPWKFQEGFTAYIRNRDGGNNHRNLVAPGTLRRQTPAEIAWHTEADSEKSDDYFTSKLIPPGYVVQKHFKLLKEIKVASL